jgi:hypothetical protein
MLRHTYSLTQESLSSGGWRTELDRIFEYTSEMEERTKVVRPDKEVSVFDDYVEGHRRLLGTTKKRRIWTLASQTAYYPLPNAVPRLIQDYVGPEFFRTAPMGEIWYIEQDTEKLRRVWREEAEFAKRILPHSSVESLLFFSPQGFSGMEVGLLPFYSLWLSLAWARPYVFGTLAAALRGYFIFLPDAPLTDLDDYEWNLTDALLDNVMDIYSDRHVPHRGPRSIFPEGVAKQESRKAYLEWAVTRIDCLVEATLGIADSITRLLVQWTISRIAIETYLIAILDVPFIRKTILYHLLDKYASLAHLAEYPFERLRTGMTGETDAWLALLDWQMWERNVQSALSRIPRPAGQFITSRTEWIYEQLRDGDPTPRMLRAYRNTSHGYRIRAAEDLLKDTGEVHNDIADISLGLWHYLLASEFVGHLQDKRVGAT